MLSYIYHDCYSQINNFLLINAETLFDKSLTKWFALKCDEAGKTPEAYGVGVSDIKNKKRKKKIEYKYLGYLFLGFIIIRIRLTQSSTC